MAAILKLFKRFCKYSTKILCEIKRLCKTLLKLILAFGCYFGHTQTHPHKQNFFGYPYKEGDALLAHPTMDKINQTEY